jgi:hypothetical protein
MLIDIPAAPAGFHFRTNEVVIEHPRTLSLHCFWPTGTKPANLAMTSEATAVIAVPCDMPEGYTFTAVVDGRQLPGACCRCFRRCVRVETIESAATAVRSCHQCVPV